MVVLAVYSIVIAHNVIPHHHHSEFFEANHYCEQTEDHDHEHHNAEECCLDHSHEDQAHAHCNFNEKTVLVKKVDISEYFFPASGIEDATPGSLNIQINYSYISTKTKEPYCRDVHLRGPPNFS